MPHDIDGIHATGRCTCAGEGRCVWCREICQQCMGDCYEAPCKACNSTGYADGLGLTAGERAAKIAALRQDEPPALEDGDAVVARLGIDVKAWAAEIRARVKAATAEAEGADSPELPRNADS